MVPLIDRHDKYPRVNGCSRLALLWVILALLAPFGPAATAEPEAIPAQMPPQQAPLAATSDPQQVAYYIVRFAQYVRWPEESAPQWLICVPATANTRAGDYASQVVRGKSFEVRKITDPGQLAGCHILDLTPLDTQAARQFLEQAQDRPILTVGGGNAFCSEGGIICLTRGEDRLSFEINLSATRQAGLLISAKLLSLGKGPAMTGRNP